MAPVFGDDIPESWYPVPSEVGYEISSRLRVRSWWTNAGLTKKEPRVLKIQVDPRNGYRYLNRTDYTSGRRRMRRLLLHRLVAELAIGPIPPGVLVRHLDDDPANNHPSNLAFGGKRDNMLDAVRNGKANTPRGEARGHVKLTDDAVRDIRARCERGEPKKAVAEIYSVDPSTVSKICSRRKWAHVP